jgi:eukaryotic-like serine/threonine-protein kinase
MGSAVRNTPTVLGRYALFDEIASGGMATVHLARLLGSGGFSRTVAIKRLHPHIAKDAEFRNQFLDEARLASRVRHPNVVQTLDVVALEDELFLVMEYVQGESLAQLLRTSKARGQRLPARVVAHVMADALHGLHSAHEAKSDLGEPLGLVHRDMSPQNVLVGLDGTARVLDFGVAKATGRIQTTQGGQLKGKLAYMAPEQIAGAGVTRQTDIFAAAVVLWEALTSRRLFAGGADGEVLHRILSGDPPQAPSRIVPDLPPGLDAIVIRGLERDPSKRFATAHEMAVAIEEAAGLIARREVAEWLLGVAGETLARRAELLAEIESTSAHIARPPSVRPRSGSDDSPDKATTDSASAVASEVAPSAARSSARRGWPLALLVTGAAAIVVALLALVARTDPKSHEQGSPETSSAPIGAASAASVESERAPPAPDPEPAVSARAPAVPASNATPASTPPTPAKARVRTQQPHPAPAAPPAGSSIYSRY